MTTEVDIKKFIVDFLNSISCANVRVIGQQIKAKCPFHNPVNNDTAFSINWQKEGNPFHCLSCGVSGNLTTLMRHFKGNCENLPPIKHEIRISDDYKEFLQLCDRHQPPKVAINQNPMYDYLFKRSNDNHGVLDVQYIVEAYKLYYCDRGRYGGRIIMPIYMHNEIVGYNNRSIKDIGTKSINQKNVSWSRFLYGFDQAVDQYHYKNRICIITEGAFDLYQIESLIKGRKYSVISLMGTVFNKHRAEILANAFPYIIFYLDDDLPGINCTNKYVEYLKNKVTVGVANTDLMLNDPGKQSKQQIIKAIKETRWV